MPLSVKLEPLNKQKPLIYPHELCIEAEKQWSSFLESIACSQRPIPLRMSEAKTSSETHMIQTLKKYYGDNGKTFFTKELSNEYSPTPWISKDKCYSKGILGLHEEIKSFCEYISPMPAEKIARDCVIKKLQSSILSIWPTTQVDVYGSYDTGLYLPTSDIDCVIQNCNLDPIVALNSLETMLKKDYDEVKVLKSKVPIVKLIDRYTSYKIDISINSSSGISSADFVKSMLQEHPNLHCLVLVIKQFLQSRGILESFSGGISSYCLILMIISYLQLHSKGDSNMGMDLLRFLELYGRRFNYTKCAISVVNGGSYYPKDQKGTLSYSLLRIEDPFDPSNDVGQSCFGVIKVREEMNRAFQLLCDAVLPQFISLQPPWASILGRIITISPEVFAYRNFIKQTFTSFLHPSPSHYIITPIPVPHPFTGHANKLPQQIVPQGLPPQFTLPITPLYLPNSFNRIFHLPPPFFYSNNQQFIENPTMLQNFKNDEKTECISDTSDSSNNSKNNLTDDISISNKMKNLNLKNQDVLSGKFKTFEKSQIFENVSENKGPTNISSASQQALFSKDPSPPKFITATTVLQLVSQPDVITQSYPVAAINNFQNDTQNTTLVPNTHLEARFHNPIKNNYPPNNFNVSNKNKYEVFKYNSTDNEDDEADTDNSHTTSYEVFTDPPSNYYEKSSTLMRYPGARGKHNQFRNSHNYAYSLNNYNNTEMNRSNSWHCNINNNNNNSNVAYIHRNNNNNGLMMSSMYSPSTYSSSSRHQHQSRYHRPHKNAFSKNYNNSNNSVIFNNTNYSNFSNSASMNSFNIRGNNNSYSNNHNYNQNKYKNNKHFRHSYTSSELVGDNKYTTADSNDPNNVKNNGYNNDSNKNLSYEKALLSTQQRQQKQVNTSKKVESKKKNNFDAVSNNSENVHTSTVCKNNRDYVKNSKNKYKLNLK